MASRQLLGLGVISPDSRRPYHKKLGVTKSMASDPICSPRATVKLSKALSRILRHTQLAAADPSGWVSIPDLQAALRWPATLEEIRFVVENNNKKRFVLDETVDPPRIRAAQGHSVNLEAPVLRELTDPADIPLAVHVTSVEGWVQICESGCLKSMNRTHIHFATLSSHMRRNRWANTFLMLKTEEAMASGHRFFLSDNDVLLCEGPLPVEFVERIYPAELPVDWR